MMGPPVRWTHRHPKDERPGPRGSGLLVSGGFAEKIPESPDATRPGRRVPTGPLRDCGFPRQYCRQRLCAAAL